MIVAILAAIITFIIGNMIEPYARQKGRVLVSEARADFLSLVIQEGSFRQVDKNVFMQVAERREGGILGGLFVSDSRDPAFDMIYYAREGSVLKQDGANLLLMADGEIHRRTVADGQVSIVRFTSYAFDLSEFTASSGKPALLPKDQTTSYLMAPDPNDKIFQTKPLLLASELHKRLAEWIYPLAFAMIAIGACAKVRSHREPAWSAMFNAVAAAFLLRWIGIFVEDASENSSLILPVIYLVPLAGVVFPALLSVRNIPIEMPRPVTIWFGQIGDRLRAAFENARVRFSGFRRNGAGA